MELNEQQFGSDWLPGISLGGSVMDRAARSINGETMQYMQRKNMGQPSIGASESDVERRAYGFYNASLPELPRIRNVDDER